MTIKKLINTISTEFGLDIRKRSRKREYIYARAVYYKIARDMFSKTLAEIGGEVGVDHATVLHSMKNVFPVIERFEPDVLTSYNKLVNKFNFEADLVKSASFTLEEAKSEIAELKYKLKLAESKAFKSVNLGDFEEMLSRVPEDKVDVLKVRLDAIIKML
jgi:hypothetical protein